MWKNGPIPGQLHTLPDCPTSSTNATRQRTLQPSVTGTSVLAITYRDGVMIAADMLGSYGSLARFRDISRLIKVNETTLLGGSGDYADFQYLKGIVEQKVIDDECLDDGFNYTPKSIFSWLTRVLYYRRSRFDPLWNIYIVAGHCDDEPFLGYIDKIGCAYQSPTLATGFGAYLARPVLREAYEKNPNMSKEEAEALLVQCMRILFYRDARSFNKFEIATVTRDGAVIGPPMSADANWDVAHYVVGYE